MIPVEILSNISQKESILLKELFLHKELSRNELKELSNLKIANYYNAVDSLLEKGLLQVKEWKKPTKKGRPANILSLNPNFCFYYCIIVQKNNYFLSVVDFSGNIITMKEKPLLNDDYTEFINSANSFLQEISDNQKYKNKIVYCGIAAGLNILKNYISEVNPNTGEIIKIPILEKFSQNFNIPIHHETISRACAYGLYLQKYIDKDNLTYFNISSGIGIGIIHNRKLLESKQDSRHTIEHWTIASSGRKCSCGNYDCIITSVGTRNIVKNAHDMLCLGTKSSLSDKIDILTFKDVALAAENNDAFALSLIEEASNIFALVLKNYTLLMQPDTVIVGGQLPKCSKQFCNLLYEKYSKQFPDVNLVSEFDFTYSSANGITAKILMNFLEKTN